MDSNPSTGHLRPPANARKRQKTPENNCISMPKRAIRPFDAATLILLDRDATSPAVLMGRRYKKHRFLPGRYVFPGGRVDRADSYVSPESPLRQEVAERIARSCTPRRAQALALAAIRETFEETGLVLGRPFETRIKRVPEAWRDFLARGFSPALDGLDYICRAVTPPFQPIRFNTRFFLADAEAARGELRGNGELLDLRWVPIHEAKTLAIPGITRYVLNLVEEGIANPPRSEAARQVSLYRYRYGKHTLGYE